MVPGADNEPWSAFVSARSSITRLATDLYVAPEWGRVRQDGWKGRSWDWEWNESCVDGDRE